NVVILLLAAGWVYRSATVRIKVLLLVVLVPIMAAYLAAQRRAAIAGLIVAGLGMCAALFFQNRRLFWKLIPALTIVAAVYTAAFWNASGAAAFPAQAIKGAIAPDKQSYQDQSSDIYRQIEAVDIVYTIRTDPLLGLGFGQRFLRPIPLPAISDFITAEYQPHNSFLWFWIKTGAFGFMTLLYLLGSLIQRGARAALQRRDDLSLLTLISTFYVMMFATFTYLDISWDVRTMVMFSMSVSLIGNVERLRQNRLPQDLL
ncbi:MAG: O-antigen ligase family protein, partial [Acidimicrobiia bacterium]